LVMTKLFAQQIPLTKFNDPDWVLELDVLFAHEYIKALNDYDLGVIEENGWKLVFEKIMAKKTSVLEELLLCIAAHIIQDLPLALVKSGWRRRPEAERIADFHLANKILGEAIEEIQSQVARRYNPLLNWFDQVGHKDDEILTDYGIRLARGMAWYNAVRFFAAPAEVAKSLTRSVENVVKQITYPAFSLTFFLRIFRLISKLTRIWPVAKRMQVKEPPLKILTEN